jgi:hypothetical protein
MSHLVHAYSPAEAAEIISALTRGEDPSFNLEGWIDLTCREADGSVAWEIHQPNLVTDYGRRRFVEGGFSGSSHYLFTSASTEDPEAARCGLVDDGTSYQLSGGLTGTYDAPTLTRTWSNTFAAPASLRQIGTVGVCRFSAPSNGQGIQQILAMSKLNPVKQQTTSQTLELQYRVTLVPVFY